MSKVCAVTGKRPMFGHNVSNANNKTNKMFRCNIHTVRVYSEKLTSWISLKLTTSGVRTISKNGGLDQWLLKTSSSRLPQNLLRIKKAVVKKMVASAVFNMVMETPMETSPGNAQIESLASE